MAGPHTNGTSHPATTPAPLDVARMLDGSQLLLLGGTGFLGKIFWIMMLDRYPQVGRIYLLVRSGKGRTSEERFWSEVATNEALKPLRDKHGDGFEAFLREKVVPLDGDVGRALCGLDPTWIAEHKGALDAVINVAGVVDFNPPLDEALDTNAFGAQNLVELCKALGDAPLFHTSTCYVVGNREGLILEDTPGDKWPFPRAAELGHDAWDPEREIRDGLDLIAQARSRCEDAFRQSVFLEEANKNLLARGEPTAGAALDAELKNVKRKFVSQRLVEAGLERATHWGWPNIYTYTKSIGEQIIARSGLRYLVARPACCESTLEFPFPGWNEGIGTSAPIVFLSMKGHHQIVGRESILDFIPSDLVCAGMILSLAELIEGTNATVYQYGASDVNPATSRRFGELIALYRRRHFQRKGTGNPFLNLLQQHMETAVVSRERFDRVGPGALAKGMRQMASLLREVPGPAASAARSAAKTLEGQARTEAKLDEIIRLFLPFTWFQKGPFSCANTRAAYLRCSEEDRAKLAWNPERIDWADYWLNQHMPAMEKRVIPWLEERYRKETKPLRAHATLASLVDQMAERHEHLPAFGRLEDDGIARVTYAETKVRADALAARLAQAGVKRGDRVLLSGKNHPDWPVAFFGIVRAGATAVPVDPGLEAGPFGNVLVESEAKVALWDGHVEHHAGEALRARVPGLRVLDLGDATQAPRDDEDLAFEPVDVRAEDVASLIFTSGTTGKPKGVRLTHGNFTSLVAALSPIFPLGSNDRVLSVLPIHHTFEFTCGLLLPFSRGARVVYLDELTGDRVTHGLKTARVTAMVGVPAVWQLLERRILAQVHAKGPVFEQVFNVGTEANRWLSKNLKLDVGKLLFGQVHQALGGHVKWLISGGAALPRETQELFAGLGLKLAEGYGLTEAAPVLTVAKAGSPPGQVGQAIPGVVIKIDAPDASGVGEVLAKGPNVMLGYTDESATKDVLTADGWLRTGDLGKLDKRGRLVLVGRAKEVVVTANGENVYPDDVERALGLVPHVKELTVLGTTSPSGGERVACLAVPEDDDAATRDERFDRAREALRAAFKKLPFHQQPSLVQLHDAPLPRTATRKVKRSEARDILERILAASAAPEGDGAGASRVRAAVAVLKNKKPSEIGGSLSLAGDLGFDSLALTDLLVALESHYGHIDPKALQAAVTVADVEELVGAPRPSLAPPPPREPAQRYRIEGRDPKKVEPAVALPREVQDVGKRLLGRLQDAFYGQAMDARVTGRAFIPQNRNVLVAANHASHLDMGFVRHALGAFGKDITTLAAQDYFFEKGSLQRAFFENFSNLRALDRKGGLRAAERQAAEVLQRGKSLLLFPEGTRSTDGSIQEFKPLIGHLALRYQVDLLPVFLGGTHAAMPKGSALPRKRELSARIGPPLTVADMRRLTEGMTPADAARAVTQLLERAVRALADGTVLEPARIASLREMETPLVHPLVRLFGELGERFDATKVDAPVSFYFTLGSDEHAKWTVKVDKAGCDIRPGKPDGGTADCVLKTSADLFTKIVRESWTPGPGDFISGAIKSNDVSLLVTFQKVFQLES